jgi:hypothetical protein
MATLLDQEQIERVNTIAPRNQSVELMPLRSGADVASELGGRLFVRYLTDSQVSEFSKGSQDRQHWVTTTALAPEHVVPWLALYAPQIPRRHALLLDPAKIDGIQGPTWIRLGQGIEYFLSLGFGEDAIVDVGVIQVR